jgi:molybdate transport system substrate-binding protein
MRIARRSLLPLVPALLLPMATAAQARPLTVAAAADLRFALDELLLSFDGQGRRVEVVYGSSGKLSTQIRNGAPFDLFLSADRSFADDLAAQGHAAGPVQPYALGFLALWSLDAELSQLSLAALVAHTKLKRLAIANPLHAPYGRRAEQALRHQGVWEAARPKLVLGDNIAQAAQFVQSGAAQAGIVALALVKAPALQGQGAYTRIPADWHAPLEQALIVTRRAAADPLAARLAAYIQSPPAQALLARYGFERRAP